jgi:hypothetical protein
VISSRLPTTARVEDRNLGLQRNSRKAREDVPAMLSQSLSACASSA